MARLGFAGLVDGDVGLVKVDATPAFGRQVQSPGPEHKNLPTDLAGQVYKTVDLSALTSVEAEVRKWASSDLGLSLVRS